ncbi:hypothetical protein N7X57_12170 [Lactiplantibacillus paraplantarum]|uniref:hypothetical protein n=1 Tax=Lactiplantibacillus paraplantarum TaxID=60520 RepID=UPI0007E3441D|nr:hypothetical protein [Lactiplantibacillus paraplantarum]MCW1911177.1 hypothetical protein [Lactiplantibacillus paraplantarum]OAX76045.1 hypothetical protein A0U96_13130 [Lactiplantibacillus plantarum]
MKKFLVSALVLSGVVGAFSFGTTKANASTNTGTTVSSMSAITTYSSIFDNGIQVKSGVVQTHNYYGTVYALVDNNGNVSRYVGSNLSYKYDQIGFMNGETYYRVSTNEWIAASNVTVLS